METTILVGTVTWEDLCKLSISMAACFFFDDDIEMRQEASKDCVWMDSCGNSHSWDAGKAVKSISARNFIGLSGNDIWLGFSEEESKVFSWYYGSLKARKRQDNSWEFLHREEGDFSSVLLDFLSAVQPETVSFQEMGQFDRLQEFVDGSIKTINDPDKVSRIRAAMSVIQADIDLERQLEADEALTKLYGSK